MVLVDTVAISIAEAVALFYAATSARCRRDPVAAVTPDCMRASKKRWAAIIILTVLLIFAIIGLLVIVIGGMTVAGGWCCRGPLYIGLVVGFIVYFMLDRM